MEERHAADRRGFGSISLPRRRGLPCRQGCAAVFTRPAMHQSIDGLRAAAAERDAHELTEHGATFAHAVAVRRRRHLVYGKAVGAE